MSSVVRFSALLLMLASCAHVHIEEKLRSEYSVDFWNHTALERRHEGKVLWRADIDTVKCGWKRPDSIREVSLSREENDVLIIGTETNCLLSVTTADGKMTCIACGIACD